MENSKKKRNSITLNIKKQIIKMAAENVGATELAKHFGIPRTTVIGIINSKNTVNSAVMNGIGPKCTRINKTRHANLEQAILMWFRQTKSQNIPVTGQLLQEKAKEIASELNIDQFQASNGWLEKFLQRHSLIFKTYQGEAGSINMTELNNWQQQNLQESISQYSPNDIFNLDETGLFWKLLPSKTLAFKGERCMAGKKSKDRITILVGSNMTGTEKLPLLVIGKSASPRCFKNAPIPIKYVSNNKAWMTTSLFSSYLTEWDRKLERSGRKILLFVDNCSVHSPNIQLQNIKMLFFLPNTTAEAQPMDQGVIQNLKVHYKQFLIRKKIKDIGDENTLSFNLLDALHMLRRAWDAVTMETIKNCFCKAKFVVDQEPINESTRINEEFESDLEILKKIDLIDNNFIFEDYIMADNDLATDGIMSLNEIAMSVKEDSDDDEELIEPEIACVSSQEASKAMEIVHRYVQKNITDQSILKMCDQIGDTIYVKRLKEMKQATLFDYMIKRLN